MSMESKGKVSAKIEVILFQMQKSISGEKNPTLFTHPAQLESLKSK